MTKLEKRGKGIILMHDFQHSTAVALPTLLLQLKANVRQESTRSNAMENNLNATVVQVGARVQY